jgi:hypothetical protein
VGRQFINHLANYRQSLVRLFSFLSSNKLTNRLRVSGAWGVTSTPLLAPIVRMTEHTLALNGKLITLRVPARTP